MVIKENWNHDLTRSLHGPRGFWRQCHCGRECCGWRRGESCSFSREESWCNGNRSRLRRKRTERPGGFDKNGGRRLRDIGQACTAHGEQSCDCYAKKTSCQISTAHDSDP